MGHGDSRKPRSPIPPSRKANFASDAQFDASGSAWPATLPPAPIPITGVSGMEACTSRLRTLFQARRGLNRFGEGSARLGRGLDMF